MSGLKPGYYLDHCGDIAIRYGRNVWDIFNGIFPEWLERSVFADRDTQAIRDEWEYLGPL